MNEQQIRDQEQVDRSTVEESAPIVHAQKHIREAMRLLAPRMNKLVNRESPAAFTQFCFCANVVNHLALAEHELHELLNAISPARAAKVA